MVGCKSFFLKSNSAYQLPRKIDKQKTSSSTPYIHQSDPLDKDSPHAISPWLMQCPGKSEGQSDAEDRKR